MDCKKFYNSLRQPNRNVKNGPGKEEVENFWREIYGEKVSDNEEASWIKDQCQQNPSMEWSPICEKDIAEALRTSLNWKAPGRDQIPNFWLKQLNSNTQAYSRDIEQINGRRFCTGVANGRSNVPYIKKRKYWKSNQLQAYDMFAYDIQTYYIHYKQTHAEIRIWRMKICYQKNRKGAKINC